MKHISTCQVMWTNEIIATGHLQIHKNSISVLSTAKYWLSGVGSYRLEFLVLASLKTTKVQPLLWHPSAMWQCYASSVNQSYVIVGSISHQYGFSKMEQQPTQQEHQWLFCGKYFHKTPFPVAVMFHGRQFRWSLRLLFLFMGVSQKQSFHL